VVADEKAVRSKGGIDLPQTAGGLPQEATVVAVGPECSIVDIGDRVIFSSYAGSELKVEDQSYLVLEAKDVLGKVD
jgi:chaperonin GroES